MHSTVKLEGGGRAYLAKNQVVGTDHQKVALYLLIYLLFHPRIKILYDREYLSTVLRHLSVYLHLIQRI
jgi:hypothetical protein